MCLCWYPASESHFAFAIELRPRGSAWCCASALYEATIAAVLKSTKKTDINHARWRGALWSQSCCDSGTAWCCASALCGGRALLLHGLSWWNISQCLLAFAFCDVFAIEGQW